MLAHQPGGFLGYPKPVALLAIVRMDAMVLAACHVTPPVGPDRQQSRSGVSGTSPSEDIVRVLLVLVLLLLRGLGAQAVDVLHFQDLAHRIRIVGRGGQA